MAVALQTTDGGVYRLTENGAETAVDDPELTGIVQDADVTRVFLVISSEQTDGAVPSVSSIDYDGVTPTLVGSSESTTGGGFDQVIFVYEVTAGSLPSSGSGKVATCTLAGGNGGVSLAVVLITGAGSEAVDGLVEGFDNDTAANPTVDSVTPAAASSTVLFFACQNTPSTVSAFNRTGLYTAQANGTHTQTGQIQIGAAASAQAQSITWGSAPGRTAWVGFAIREASTSNDAEGTGEVTFSTAGTAQLEREASGTGEVTFAAAGAANTEQDAAGGGEFGFAAAGTAALDSDDLEAAGTGAFEFAASGGATHAAVADVGLLDSGNSGVVTGGSGSVGVDVTTGNGNRKLLVGFTCESSTNTDVATLTFNGQELVALGLQVPSSEANPNSFARVKFYEQFEGGMPADGTATLSFTFTSATGDKAIFFWLVDNARQDQLATGAQNSVLAAGGAGTTIGTAITAGAAGAFLASVAYKNASTGTLTLTAPAASTTDADLNGAGSGDRLGGGHKAGSLSVGSDTVTWTHSSEARRALSVVVVNPVPEARQVGGGGVFGFSSAGTAELGSQSAAGDGEVTFATSGTAARGRVADGTGAFEFATAGTANSPSSAGTGEFAFASAGTASAPTADGAGEFSFATAGTAQLALSAAGGATFSFGTGGLAIGPGAGGAVELSPFVTAGTAAVLVQGSGAGELSFASAGAATVLVQGAGGGEFGFATAGAAALVRSASGFVEFTFSAAGTAEVVPATTADVRARERLRTRVIATDQLAHNVTTRTRLRTQVIASDVLRVRADSEDT